MLQQAYSTGTPPVKQNAAQIFSLDAHALKNLSLPWCPKTGFYQVPNDLTRRAGRHIGPYAIAVYNVLASYSRPDGTCCFPSLDTIAEEAGMSRPTVIKEIALMERCQMVIKIPTKPGRPTSNNYYRLLPPSMWDFSRLVNEVDSGVKPVASGVKPVDTKNTQTNKTKFQKHPRLRTPRAAKPNEGVVEDKSSRMASPPSTATPKRTPENERTAAPPSRTPEAVTIESTAAQMVEAGWNGLKDAERVAEKEGIEDCQKQLAFLCRVKAQLERESRKPLASPGGMLRKALVEDWDEIDWKLAPPPATANGAAYAPYVDTPPSQQPCEPVVAQWKREKSNSCKKRKSSKCPPFDPALKVALVREKLAAGHPPAQIDALWKSNWMLEDLTPAQWSQVVTLVRGQGEK